MLDTHKEEFIGKDQPYMRRTCDVNPGLCKLVVPDKKHGNAWFYMAPYMMGQTQEVLHGAVHDGGDARRTLIITIMLLLGGGEWGRN